MLPPIMELSLLFCLNKFLSFFFILIISTYSLDAHSSMCALNIQAVLELLWFGQFSSVAQSCLTHCNPMDCSMPGSPVHHQLPELTQTHVHWVGDAIKPSHPLSSPSPPTFNLSQHQDLFKWVTSLHQVAKVLEFQLWHQSPTSGYSGLISVRMDWLDLPAVQGALKSSPAPQFKSINSLVLSFLYSPTPTSIHDYWKNHSFDKMDLSWQNMALLFNMLSSLVITFLPRSKCLNFMAAVTIWSDFGAPPPK